MVNESSAVKFAHGHDNKKVFLSVGIQKFEAFMLI